MESSRRTLLALSIALGAALVLIAFLLGRESVRTPNREPAVAAFSRTPIEGSVPERPAEEERPWPKWADLADGEDSDEGTTLATEVVGDRIERTPQQDSVAFSNRGSRPEPTPMTGPPGHSRLEDREAAVAAYFRQVDVIHTEEGAGDPNAFAMSLIKGGLGGATSGFDRLIADTKEMEREMQRLSPPPSCQRYHEASLEALVESRQLLEDIKQAIAGRDIDRLKAIALRSNDLRSKVEAIERMRKLLLSDSTTY